MKKTYSITVDCAGCAAKMEQAVSKIAGVKGVSVSFITQKLVLETEEGVSQEQLLPQVSKTVKKIDRHCEIS